MRLGAYAAILKDKTQVLKLYQETGRLAEDAKKIQELMKDKSQAFRIGILEKGKKIVLERHRHRYEVNPEFHAILEEKGLVLSGLSPNGKLVESLLLTPQKAEAMGLTAPADLTAWWVGFHIEDAEIAVGQARLMIKPINIFEAIQAAAKNERRGFVDAKIEGA